MKMLAFRIDDAPKNPTVEVPLLSTAFMFPDVLPEGV
jgi:hypothetical protein